jgi:CubicO group peptidase (beta-lactamase class C family)
VHERLASVSFADPYLHHEVTLRDLLAHRTGVQPANALFYFTGYDRDEVLSRVKLLEAQVPFRTEMVYSNVMYTVAGEMAARAAGTSWAELIRDRVLRPAGMASTVVETRPESVNLASPHAVIGGVQRTIRPFDFRMVGPASSIHSNALDMARWLRLQLNEGLLDGQQIVSRASMEAMHTPWIIIRTTRNMRAARLVEHFAGYGMGWQIMDYRGEPLLWHSGNADGMPVYMALLPGRELGLVVMLNTWAAPGLHGALVSRILDFYLGAPPRDWSGEALERYRGSLERERASRKAVAASRAVASRAGRPLADYVGTYDAKWLGDVHVRLAGESLTLQVAEGAIADLAHAAHDAFHLTWRDPVFREYFYGTQAVFAGDSERIVRLSLLLNRDAIDATRR